jgi:hypothetical protein
MIIIDSTVISDELYLVKFECNLKRCFGCCCIAGDAGAPLDEDEISLLEDDIENIKPYMTDRGVKAIEDSGVFDYDAKASFVTPLVNDAECAYVFFRNGIAGCAIEKAFEERKTRFQKPVSCHLYPVRISHYGDFDAVNFHKWQICKPALKNGGKLGTPLYKFLKSALIRKYGLKWYQTLVKEVKRIQSEKIPGFK